MLGRTTLLLSLGLVFLCAQTSCDKNCKATPKEDCFCTQQYDPVCGCNKETYGNACTAECNGITDFKKGVCK